MTLEQQYREECDTLRLLVEVLEQAAARHLIDNAESINRIQVLDWNEYRKPEAIPFIIRFLGSALLTHIMSLLEFRLRVMVIYLVETSGRVISDDLKRASRENVLDWMKKVIKETDGVGFDFGTELFERLRAWLLIRNDVVHNGGYRSERVNDRHIQILNGVGIGQLDNIYNISFGGCEAAIDDVENFFKVTEHTMRSSFAY